jgi:hypothetical protein
MTPDEREQMNSLSTRIQEEKDYRRFVGLLRELNELVSRKEHRFPQHNGGSMWQRKGPWRMVSGVVQKIIKSVSPNHADSVEISIGEAEDLFREIRIENRFSHLDGQTVALRQGAHVDVTFEADSKDISR